MRQHFLLLAMALCFFACTPEGTPPTTGQAYVPVYVSSDSVTQISVEPARPIVQAGKIYVYGNYLFENDANKGIHIIDLSDRANPKKIAFLSIPLSTEVAVKGSFLYTNNLDDLLTFDISNPASPKLVKRIENVFPMPNQQYPPFTGVNFECADAKKGVVIRWELKQVENAKCRR